MVPKALVRAYLHLRVQPDLFGDRIYRGSEKPSAILHRYVDLAYNGRRKRKNDRAYDAAASRIESVHADLRPKESIPAIKTITEYYQLSTKAIGPKLPRKIKKQTPIDSFLSGRCTLILD
ncbi:hypothetical protein [uncultured Herbaspirillum sp.]|uniref:hypothetical protein n=1 Tax=uncultured Herbaspirillum sp. TaxID=160236 RepID=UPI0026211A20|nr:hypothetical protein [uncultured Herbaspirillum sp.]